MWNKGKKIIFFITFLIFIWIISSNILQQPVNVDWATKGMDSVKKNPNYYDVIVAGTSMAITNVSAEELYMKYGIASRSIGEPEQMTLLSYYALENALKYQNPKVVLFDTQALFYTEDKLEMQIKNNAQTYVHYTLDQITDVKIKYDAVKNLKKLNNSVNYWEYFSKMYNNHANWEDISEENFKDQIGKDLILGSRNLSDMWENVTDIKSASEKINSGQVWDIPEINKEYLKKISSLCKKKNINLVLIRSCGSANWVWEQYNAVEKLAEDLDVEFLDLAVKEDNIGFDWQTDSYDGSHHNIIGTKKWTDYIGKYLIDNYEFTDKRNDTKYQEFERAKEKYEDIVEMMNLKIDLIRAINLNQFLDTLLNMKKENITIFVSAYNQADSQYSPISQNYFSALGLNVDLKEKNNYYGILDNGIDVVESCNEQWGKKEGMLDSGAEYEISSDGEVSDMGSSIKINGIEYVQNGRGINIVVYDKKTDDILSSVYFDTFSDSNPSSCRIKNGVQQIETDVNVWKDKE